MPSTPDQRGLLLVISGPSGVGKTTITQHVVRQMQGSFSVSVTTRPKTRDDVEGRDYKFIDVATFKRMRDAGELLEWAEVFGHFYGTPREPVERALAEARLMVLEIDVEGAVQVRENLPEALAIFVLPPSEQALLERLRRRAREDEEVIQNRFRKARHEIERALACGAYDYFIVNDQLEAAIARAVRLVQAELSRRGQTPA